MAIDIGPVLFRFTFPAVLTKADVRALLGTVAASTRQSAAALRLGIDRWVGRLVESEEVLDVVTAEISDALASLCVRYRLERD